MNGKSENFSKINSLNIISDFMIRKGETIAVAESVTAGCVQTLLSTSENASSFFQGGITAYNLSQKTKNLGIDPLQAMANNCVSENIAAQMAQGVTKQFSCDWGISITGYAARIPEQGINTLFAFYAFAYRGEALQTSILISSLKESLQAQHYYAASLVHNFARYLQEVSVSIRTI